MSILGENIKRIRKARGYTITYLADRAGVGISTISQVETGRRQNLQADILIKIAKALGVDTAELPEPEQEHEVTDLLDTLCYIMLSDDLSIDGKEMNRTEKEEFMLAAKVSINMIREKRK